MQRREGLQQRRAGGGLEGGGVCHLGAEAVGHGVRRARRQRRQRLVDLQSALWRSARGAHALVYGFALCNGMQRCKGSTATGPKMQPQRLLTTMLLCHR